jgi:hypothetical protein
MRIRRVIGVVVALLPAVTVVSGCVSPAVDEGGYRGKVGHSAEQMMGIVNTARLAVQLDLRGKMTQSLLDTVVTDAENDAQSVLTAFETVQPPDPASIRLRTSADDVLQEAASNLSDLRIAVRRSDRGAKAKLVADLDKSTEDLQRLEGSG